LSDKTKDKEIKIYLGKKTQHEGLPPHLGFLQIGLFSTLDWAVERTIALKQEFPEATTEALQASVRLMLQRDLSRYPNIEVLYDD